MVVTNKHSVEYQRFMSLVQQVMSVVIMRVLTYPDKCGSYVVKQ